MSYLYKCRDRLLRRRGQAQSCIAGCCTQLPGVVIGDGLHVPLQPGHCAGDSGSRFSCRRSRNQLPFKAAWMQLSAGGGGLEQGATSAVQACRAAQHLLARRQLRLERLAAART